MTYCTCTYYARTHTCTCMRYGDSPKTWHIFWSVSWMSRCASWAILVAVWVRIVGARSLHPLTVGKASQGFEACRSASCWVWVGFYSQFVFSVCSLLFLFNSGGFCDVAVIFLTSEFPSQLEILKSAGCLFADHKMWYFENLNGCHV